MTDPGFSDGLLDSLLSSAVACAPIAISDSENNCDAAEISVSSSFRRRASADVADSCEPAQADIGSVGDLGSVFGGSDITGLETGWNLIDADVQAPMEDCDHFAQDLGSSQAEDVAATQEQYDRALFAARREVVASASLSFPWESGIFSSIFNDEPLNIPGPIGAIIEPSFPDNFDKFRSAVNSGVDPRMDLKRKPSTSIHTVVMSTHRDVDALQQDANLWVASITKWQLIFEFVSFSGQIGTRLLECSSQDPSGELERSIIRDVLGIKSPRTASKRADSLRKFFSWCGYAKGLTWPVQPNWILEYLSEDDGRGPASTTGLALMEAIRFGRYVMGIEFKDEVLSDPQIRGRVNRLLVEKSNYTPARALLCSEVASLERFVTSDQDIGDIYIAGFCLFALFSRCRWSDLRYLDSITDDRTVTGGELYGFLESSTALHKTSTSAIRKQRHMPIVCPILGVTGLDWTTAWFDSLRAVGLDMKAEPLGALCRVLKGDGHVGKRSCTSDEITKFLNVFFKTDSSNRLTSHSLKETTLSWAARYGIDENSRILLGHHELVGSKSLATYSRDMLSRPLQHFCAMLLNIRKDFFRPDTTRSGWMSHGVQNDSDASKKKDLAHDDENESLPSPSPIHSEDRLQVSQHDIDDENSELNSASDSSDSDDSNAPEEALYGRMDRPAKCDVPGPLYQNNKSKVLHKVGDALGLSRCGVKITDKFTRLDEGASLKWARCGRCFKGEVIATAEEMVEALDKVRSQRLDAHS